ncbi:hypothetical protein [uncultured Kocuria sp.]|uniref:hypothetical protein n=1 Tax=uncultured Kocuria sp. TaxID=259305 RepID=UPI002637B794|nr:hypothetical protein [uncultured Kocuria sp.]
MPGTTPRSIVEGIDRTDLPPRPPQRLDDRAVPVLHEETLTRRPARVDVVSGADPAVQGYRTACRELLERAGL